MGSSSLPLPLTSVCMYDMITVALGKLYNVKNVNVDYTVFVSAL